MDRTSLILSKVLVGALKALSLTVILFIVATVYDINLPIDFYALFWGLSLLITT